VLKYGFSVVFYRSKLENEPLNEPLNDEHVVFTYIQSNPGCKRADIVLNTGFSLSKVKRLLSNLDSVEKRGSDKTGGYYSK
jgi:uncharacterized membrane protein